MTTGASHLMRIALVVAGPIALLTIAVALLVRIPAARAYDGDYYDFCKNSLQQPDSVCCANSGGQITNGVCADPAAAPTPLPTITQQILPPVIGGPR
jgi:hypothetical protein